MSLVQDKKTLQFERVYENKIPGEDPLTPANRDLG